jgi:hypothetical protein
MPAQKYKVGDRVKYGVITGEIIQVLSPLELPNSDETMPRYLVMSDNDQVVEAFQQGLEPAADKADE